MHKSQEACWKDEVATQNRQRYPAERLPNTRKVSRETVLHHLPSGCSARQLVNIYTQTQKRWAQKMWYIYTIEYYTAEKNYDIGQLDGSRKHHIEWGNLDLERQISYVLTHKWPLDLKERKTAYKSQSQRTWIPMRTLRETYIDLIYMGNRKRQDLLSKLGAWGPWERVEEERRGREGSREKCKAQKIQ